MESLNFDGKFIQEANYSQLQGKCLELHTLKHVSFAQHLLFMHNTNGNYLFQLSTQFNDKLLVQKKNFNKSSLPKHIDQNTVFGIRTKSLILLLINFILFSLIFKTNGFHYNYYFSGEFGINNVVFPSKLSEERFVDGKNSTESHEIFHHINGIGEQLNRKQE